MWEVTGTGVPHPGNQAQLILKLSSDVENRARHNQSGSLLIKAFSS